MKEDQKEILKRKKIRKLLLLKINDELKEISKYKSNIKINSKTIQELNKLYNKNDILLYEKSIIYSNFIKTEETVISKNISSINISKTIDKPKTRAKTKIKNKIENDIIFEINSYEEEESASPIINYVPKKIELGRKKFLKSRAKQRNNESIPNLNKFKNKSDKEIRNENIINKSTKLGGDIHLDKLIEKISLIKNKENTEGIIKIKENIKKLRKYCYQLKKKKKKKKRKFSVNRENRKRRTKEKDEKIFSNFKKRRNTITNKNFHIKTYSLFQQKMEKNEEIKENEKNNEKNETSPTLNINARKKSSKILKISNLKLRSKLSFKNVRYFSPIKPKDKIKKIKMLDEDEEDKIIKEKSNNSNKKKVKRSLKTELKHNNKINFMTLNNIPKEVTHSSINILKTKINNTIEEKKEKNMKNNKIKYNIKLLNKNINNNLISNKENESGLKYINLKKDKIELHDNLIKKNSKNLKKHEIKKDISKKNKDIIEDLRSKKMNIIIDLRKKSKKKLIESNEKKVIRYSNIINYNTNIISNPNQLINVKNTKSFLKRSRKDNE